MRETFQPTVYLLGSHKQGTLYLGVTSNLLGRLWQHRNDAVEGFTHHYGVERLLWFEQHSAMHACGDHAREAAEEVAPRLEDRVG